MSKQTTPPEAYKADWLKSMDKRTSIANDLQQRHIALCDDLGGIETLSYQQRALIDRCIFLEYHLQQEEMKLATGGEFDSGKWVQACNSLNGLFSKLGLQRQKRELSLTQYVKAKE
ncbi:MAG: hypothetical protein MK088_06595 [Alteromonas sp.]|nr:hypothetical protein [Gammaproteobacteria bacterium]MCH2256282.1 hypothetical protein [Alteromonas sp.]